MTRLRYEIPRFGSSLRKRTGGGGVTEVDAHPAWGDPFVEQWKAFYKNVDQNQAPKTSAADYVQDLELFAEIAQRMREP